MSYYFVNGKEVTSLIKNHGDFRPGDMIYNQIIESKETWKETRNREGLIMILISKKLYDSGKINYSIHETINGIVQTKIINSKELFNLVK